MSQISLILEMLTHCMPYKIDYTNELDKYITARYSSNNTKIQYEYHI